MQAGKYYFFLFVFSSHSSIFYSFGDITITDEGQQILSYTRHFWPIGSEGSLTCQTYCYTGQSFIMVIFEDPWRLAVEPKKNHPKLPTKNSYKLYETLCSFPYHMGILIQNYFQSTCMFCNYIKLSTP